MNNEMILKAELQITDAIAAYRTHTTSTAVLNEISEEFVDRLAADSVTAKENLREFFKKSPHYDPELDALVLDGVREHQPKEEKVKSYIVKLTENFTAPCFRYGDYSTAARIRQIIPFFSKGWEISKDEKAKAIAAINSLAPTAYHEGRKKSRIFRDICVSLGIWDETAGSEFQKTYALLADELKTGRENFKLYVSINPAHFLTMSNPKKDERGDTLVSCHSLNSTEYQWNNGCSGYARDSVSIIAFTVENPENPETFYNRKTSRQIFAYNPQKGVLLQSRLYNTSGGTEGAAEISDTYRDMITAEFAALEGMGNSWKISENSTADIRKYVTADFKFGGYKDWIYSYYAPKICFLEGLQEAYEPLKIGKAGLCIICGEESSYGLYCDACDEDSTRCDDCGCRCDFNDLTEVYNQYGYGQFVCDSCREENYEYCEDCGSYHHCTTMTYLSRQYYSVCEECLSDYYEQCDKCGEYFSCSDEPLICFVDPNGDYSYVCDDCNNRFVQHCPHCDERVEFTKEGTCPNCGVVVEEVES